MAQSMYLTEDEMIVYCEAVPVTVSQVRFASSMIDAYIGLIDGKSKFEIHECTEKVRFNRKGIGRVKRSPILVLTKATVIGNGHFGLSEFEVDTHNFDYDELGYIYTTNLSNDINSIISGVTYPREVKFTYLYGYDEIPEPIKVACAMIAMNIAQSATFLNLDSMTTLDARFSLSDPSVITSEIRRLLSGYRL